MITEGKFDTEYKSDWYNTTMCMKEIHYYYYNYNPVDYITK